MTQTQLTTPRSPTIRQQQDAFLAGYADGRDTWIGGDLSYARKPEGHPIPLVGCEDVRCRSCAYSEGFGAAIKDGAAKFFRDHAAAHPPPVETARPKPLPPAVHSRR